MQLDPLKKAVNDQKKYSKLRLLFTILLIFAIGISTYSIYQYQKLKEQDLMRNQQTLSIRSDLIKNIYLNWDTLSQDPKKTLNILTELILSTRNYGDLDLRKLQDTIKYVKTKNSNSTNLNDILSAINVTDPNTQSIIKKLDNSDSSIIALQNTVTASKNPPTSFTKTQLNKISQQVSNILATAENSKIDSAVKLTPTVDPSLIPTNPSKTVSTTYSKDFGIKWFKPNYYLQYENVRVFLQELNKKKGIKIRICKTLNDEDCLPDNALINDKWISLRSPLSVRIDNSKYQISLQSIDRGGNNPFNLAAYISVIKLGTDSSNFFLQNSTIKLYSIASTNDEAKKIDMSLRESGVDSKYLGTPEGYTLNGVAHNQIVYYNDDQFQKCKAVQSLLKSKGFGEFDIRKSSGFGYKTDHFKIYLVRWIQ